MSESWSQVNIFDSDIRGRFDGKRGALDTQRDYEKRRANAEQDGRRLHDT